MEQIKDTEISPQNLTNSEVSPELEKTATALCDLKVGLDRLARQRVGQPFLDDWMDNPRGGTCAYTGHEFLRLILPFLDWESDDPTQPYRAYVDPQHVLGASIKGLPEHIADEEVAKRITSYSSQFGSKDHVSYIRYRALGLFWAHEGKHRVAFMRAHKQNVIAAWVREANYPRPERLVVLAPNDERDEWLALLDGQFLQVLRRPRVSLRFLTAYGVKTARWVEIPGLPNERLVREAIYARRLHRPQKTLAERERTLNLEDIHKQEQAAAIIVDRRVHELVPLNLVWRPYFFVVVFCLLGGFFFFELNVDILKPIGWGLSGVAIGLMAALPLIRFRGPRNIVLGNH
ncbi:hypothetical protein [Vogesella indigofera]|uniref:hypothetical protein n=1 Tax=Vogesella indigofera TaxID=45465 RepID=UPI0035B0B8A5